MVRVGAVPDFDLLKIRKYCEEKTPLEFRSEMPVEAGVRGQIDHNLRMSSALG